MMTPRPFTSHIKTGLRRAKWFATQIWDWLFDSNSASVRQPPRRVRLKLESLEERDCPSSAPVLDAIPNQTNSENEVVQVAAHATDADGDPIVYSATNLPPGVVIEPISGSISGTIDYSAAEQNGGVYQVSVTATDSTNLSDTKTFTWIVGNTNQAPSVMSIPDQTSAQGESIFLQVMATDPDGNPLTYSAADLPNGLSISPTGLISGSIDFGTTGSYASSVTVTDVTGLSTTVPFNWFVTSTFLVTSLSTASAANDGIFTLPEAIEAANNTTEGSYRIKFRADLQGEVVLIAALPTLQKNIPID